MRHEINLKLIYDGPMPTPHPFFLDGKDIYLILSELSQSDGVLVLTKNARLVELVKEQQGLADIAKLNLDDIQFLHDELCPLHRNAIGTLASKLSLFLAILHARLDELKERFIDRSSLN